MKRLILTTMVVLLSAPNVMGQLPCTADFNCDQNVDASDVGTFLSQFGRNPFNSPCPDCHDSPCPCTICPYGLVYCGGKCVDPKIDEDHCGASGECIGGRVCGDGELCEWGVCVACEIIYSVGAYVPKTGQTTSYATGDDGDLEKGVLWPNPRFTDNGDGTVTDNLTGLIWLKDANCFGTRTWLDALSDCNGLADGSCGLTDGSNAGDWRLPNYKELFSLVDAKRGNPALPLFHPFDNALGSYYWSSTAKVFDHRDAWCVDMYDGDVDHVGKTLYQAISVWPVRDPL